MEKIIWQTDNCKMYIRFRNDYVDNFFPRPCASFIIGVELKKSSWIGGELTYRAEDGFNMTGSGLLSELGRLVNSYSEKEFRIQDAEADTDGYILFDCKPDCVKVSGQLGATFCGDVVSKFKFTANASILYNLYDALKEKTIY